MATPPPSSLLEAAAADDALRIAASRIDDIVDILHARCPELSEVLVHQTLFFTFIKWALLLAQDEIGEPYYSILRELAHRLAGEEAPQRPRSS